jgi:3',5'-cyclic AMP phosphodiesterase CpdA
MIEYFFGKAKDEGINKPLIGPVGDGHVNGNKDYIRFVFISDTHSMHRQLQLPKGDVLIHTGDFSMIGRQDEIEDFSDWLGTLDFKHKIVVSGNHEVTFDLEREQDIRKRFQLGYA